MYKQINFIFILAFLLFLPLSSQMFSQRNVNDLNRKDFRGKIVLDNSVRSNFHNKINSQSGFIDSLIYFTFDQYNDFRKHKETFNYNNENLVDYKLDKIWEPDSNNYINYSQETTAFDGNNITQKLGELWRDNEWQNWWKSEYTYDENGRKKDWQYYTHLIFAGWSPGVKETYTYDASDNLILKEAITNFQFVWRDSLIYDSNNKLIEYFAEDWVNDQWVNDWREIYSYSSNELPMEIIREDWVNDQWINDWRKTFSYDANGNLTLMEYYVWNNSSEWQLLERASYNYSTDYMVNSKYEGNDNGNWILINGIMEFDDVYENRFYYSRHAELNVYYDGITDVSDNEIIVNNFYLDQNYPNPFNPSTIIKYSIPEVDNVTLKIYNVLGKEIKTLVNREQRKGNYEINFDASNLTSGIYFYRLETGQFTQTKKMNFIK